MYFSNTDEDQTEDTINENQTDESHQQILKNTEDVHLTQDQVCTSILFLRQKIFSR